MEKHLLKLRTARSPQPLLLATPLTIGICNSRYRRKAFTLIELLLVVAIIGTLLAVGVPIYSNTVYKAKVNSAIAKIALMGKKIEDFLVDNGRLPDTLSELGEGNSLDPWGNPYQYLPILGRDRKDVEAKWRKDRFLVPLNQDFDLYSMGKDEQSRAPLTAHTSWDDIVRANNGGYVGLASKY